MRRRTRRICMWAATALVATAALAASQAPAATNAHGAWSFVSNPALHPPSVSVTTNSPNVAPGYVFVAPIANAALRHPLLGGHGPEIVDNDGNPVWQDPLGHKQVAMSFHAAEYLGQPVLAWWEGRISNIGIGSGGDVIVDSHYNRIATIHDGNGFHTDFHELLLTSRGTAIVTGWKAVTRDLSHYHGSKHGQVLDMVVQEVNVRTGRVVWQWDPLQHVGLDESYTNPGGGQPWDAYHLNSVDVDRAGNILISARNTWAIYAVDRRSGNVVYRIGGKRSSFKLERGTRFAWQHDAHFQPGRRISLFDDEAAPVEGRESRAIVIRLDMRHHAAHLVSQYVHPKPPLLAGSQGNMQPLPNGDVFVGWGQLPYLSEFSASGALLWDAHFHGPDESYRAYRAQWTGDPLYPPSAAARSGGGATTVYASWNGATQVAQWQLTAGPSAQQLSAAGPPVPRGGFETAIQTSSAGPYFAVQALDGSGNVLGTSPAVHP